MHTNATKLAGPQVDAQPIIAKFVADLRKISIELASKQTNQNTLNLFSYMRTS